MLLSRQKVPNMEHFKRETTLIVQPIRRKLMSVEAHIQQLEQRHQILETEISELHSSPSSTDSELALLKRRKLKLKDEIHRLKSAEQA